MTLGWREQDDLALAIKHLRELGTVSTIGLWGRSMGAVTALLYSQKDPSIAGVVSQINVHVHPVSAIHTMSAHYHHSAATGITMQGVFQLPLR